MREILFRGKRVDNGEWIFGDFAGGYLICENLEDTENATGRYYGHTPYVGFVEVIPETVGQYTGQLDKNGRKIFEGDILHVVSWECDYKTTVGPRNGYKNGFYVEGDFGDSDFTILDWAAEYWRDDDAEIEVIGNIHDNPELLGNAHE